MGRENGWVEAYTKATYRRWFDDGEPAGEEPNISCSLTEIGQDANHILDLATSLAAVSSLEKATSEAKALGVFGSPSFVVNREVFWGDDRLEDALTWASKGSLS